MPAYGKPGRAHPRKVADVFQIERAQSTRPSRAPAGVTTFSSNKHVGAFNGAVPEGRTVARDETQKAFE
jgi:hypothetical protein